MNQRINLVALLIGLTLTSSCGGGSGGKHDDPADDPIDNPVSDENPIDDAAGEVGDDPIPDPGEPTVDPSENPGETAGQNPVEASPLPGVTSATNLKTLSIAVRIPEDNAGVTRAVRATSIVSQVSRVYVEALIDGALFGTVDLAQSSSDILLYAGSITIPVNVSVTLHAVAVSADSTLLFETSREGLTATEFGSPAIELNLQRRVPLEPAPRANTAPVIKSILVADRSSSYGQAVAVTVEAEDPQDDAILYAWLVSSGPEGVDLSTLMGQANDQGAIFTAPSVAGVYSVRITVSDTEGATSSQEVVINVSETGLDDTPDVQVRLSDFPDCVRLNIGETSCATPETVAQATFTNTIPSPRSINPSYRYNTATGGYQSYSVNTLFAMGFRFQWSDTCTGDNFVDVDTDGNQFAAESSTRLVPTFVKFNVEAEACQVSLTITNPEGLTQDYVTALTFTTQYNNTSDELNCEEDPATLRPKVRLVCPAMMTEVPARVRVETCDAQGDLRNLSLSMSNTINDGLWAWYRTDTGRTSFGRRSGNGNGGEIFGNDATAEFLVYLNNFPWANRPTQADIEAAGADYWVDTSVARGSLVQPVALRVNAIVYDILGIQRLVSCLIPVAPDIDLTPVIP